MPRNAKRGSNQPNQTAAAQAYGVAGEQKAAMNEMPLPKAPGAGPADATPPGGGPDGALGGQVPLVQATTPTQGDQPLPGAMPAPAPEDPSVLAALHQEPPSGPFLGDATTRPNEPVTHGLPTGPGAGPEVLGLGPAGPQAQPQAPSPTVLALRAIAQANGGDAGINALASDAQRRNL